MFRENVLSLHPKPRKLWENWHKRGINFSMQKLENDYKGYKSAP